MPRTTPQELETELVASITVGNRDYRLSGRADRVDRREEGLIILDYKTGALPAPKNTAWSDIQFWTRLARWDGPDDDPQLLEDAATRLGSVQLPLYCWLYAAARGETPADAAFVELRDGGAEKPLFGPRCDQETREDVLENLIPSLLSFLLRHLTLTPAFPPRPMERRCAYCDYRTACGARGEK